MTQRWKGSVHEWKERVNHMHWPLPDSHWCRREGIYLHCSVWQQTWLPLAPLNLNSLHSLTKIIKLWPCLSLSCYRKTNTSSFPSKQQNPHLPISQQSQHPISFSILQPLKKRHRIHTNTGTKGFPFLTLEQPSSPSFPPAPEMLGS